MNPYTDSTVRPDLEALLGSTAASFQAFEGLAASHSNTTHAHTYRTSHAHTFPRPTPGSVHEWLLDTNHTLTSPTSPTTPTTSNNWLAPITMLAWLAAGTPSSTSSTRPSSARPSSTRPRRVLWIGRRVWPYLPALPRALHAPILVDPPDLRQRLWAIDAALRCPGVDAVVADASGLDLTATRRAQLAAAAGRTIGLLARPISELRALSAACSRWRLTPTTSTSTCSPTTTTTDCAPGWHAELLRCKGVRPTQGAHRWRVRIDHETGDVRVADDPGDRPVEAQGQARGRTAG